MPIDFSKYVDYNNIHSDNQVAQRKSYLNEPEKKVLQPEKSRRYKQIGEFFNR